MTLDELRRHFWWLGPDRKNSYITALADDTATVKVMQTSWTRRTAAYEESLARDFAAVGVKVKWLPFWSDKLRGEIGAARDAAEKNGQKFVEADFVEQMRRRDPS